MLRQMQMRMQMRMRLQMQIGREAKGFKSWAMSNERCKTRQKGSKLSGFAATVERKKQVVTSSYR